MHNLSGNNYSEVLDRAWRSATEERLIFAEGTDKSGCEKPCLSTVRINNRDAPLRMGHERPQECCCSARVTLIKEQLLPASTK